MRARRPAILATVFVFGIIALGRHNCEWMQRL
jgi:hypothetical protein